MIKAGYKVNVYGIDTEVLDIVWDDGGNRIWDLITLKDVIQPYGKKGAEPPRPTRYFFRWEVDKQFMDLRDYVPEENV